MSRFLAPLPRAALVAGMLAAAVLAPPTTVALHPAAPAVAAQTVCKPLSAAGGEYCITLPDPTPPPSPHPPVDRCDVKPGACVGPPSPSALPSAPPLICVKTPDGPACS